MALESSLRSATAFGDQHLRPKLAQAEPHQHCLAQCSPCSLTSALLGQVSAVGVVCDSRDVELCSQSSDLLVLGISGTWVDEKCSRAGKQSAGVTAQSSLLVEEQFPS